MIKNNVCKMNNDQIDDYFSYDVYTIGYPRFDLHISESPYYPASVVYEDSIDYYFIDMSGYDWENYDELARLAIEEYEKYEKDNNMVEIYTSLTGTDYDVYDFIEVLESLLGDLPSVCNEKRFYSMVQKIAFNKGYRVVWISKSLTNDVLIDVVLDKPHYAVVGFGISKKNYENILFDSLEVVKDQLQQVTDEDLLKSVFEYYKNKLDKYNL